MASTTTATAASTSMTRPAPAIRTVPSSARPARRAAKLVVMAQLPPRRRSQGPDWLRPITDRLSPTVKGILIADVAIFLFYVMVRESRAFMQTHLALGSRFFAGEVWQPLTSLFVH